MKKRIRKLALLIFAALIFIPTPDTQARGGRGGGGRGGGGRGGRMGGRGGMGRGGMGRGGFRGGRGGGFARGRGGSFARGRGQIGRAAGPRKMGPGRGPGGIGRGGRGRGGIGRGLGRGRGQWGRGRGWGRRRFRRYGGYWWPYWYGSYFLYDNPWSYWYPSAYYRQYETIPVAVYKSYWNVTNNTGSDITIKTNAGEFFIQNGLTKKVLKGNSNTFTVDVMEDVDNDGQADVIASDNFANTSNTVQVLFDQQGNLIATG